MQTSCCINGAKGHFLDFACFTEMDVASQIAVILTVWLYYFVGNCSSNALESFKIEKRESTN